jgi:glutathione S-transferase
MMAEKPTLYTLHISHYCEKARWALDWHRIPFDEVCWPPGPHRVFAKRLGAPASALPLLKCGDELTQGSSEIIDWCEAHAPSPERTLTPEKDKDAAQALEIEDRANRVLGVHIRRMAYAETIPRQAHYFRSTLLTATTGYHRALGVLMWPITKQLMIKAMKLHPSEAPKSRARVAEELDWIDQLLSDGRPYLAGDRFSRADLTVASLLSPLARPQEMPIYRDLPMPPALQEDEKRWGERPAMQWVRRQYREHRRP